MPRRIAPSSPGAGEATGDLPEVDEEAAKELRRREREAEQPWRRGAAAHSAELGAACVKHLTRVRDDERVVRVLSAFDLGGELDKLALAGRATAGPAG